MYLHLEFFIYCGFIFLLFPLTLTCLFFLFVKAFIFSTLRSIDQYTLCFQEFSVEPGFLFCFIREVVLSEGTVLCPPSPLGNDIWIVMIGRGVECYWHLVVRDQRCYLAPHKAQDSLPQSGINPVQMSVVSQVEKPCSTRFPIFAIEIIRFIKI